MSTLVVDSITYNTDENLKVMVNGSMRHHNKTTVSEATTIASGSNSLLVGPVTVPGLTVTGNLNVVDTLTVSGDLTITGHLRIS
jgi:hypothetical protein